MLAIAPGNPLGEFASNPAITAEVWQNIQLSNYEGTEFGGGGQSPGGETSYATPLILRPAKQSRALILFKRAGEYWLKRLQP